ncbi:recQ-mediated genome instability protein 2-like isoform X1 [Zingiber officinale]|uniref:recQ-mediated genome instability protein 2-like isoform X1 n=1 Tax=Zingiber officinale TaxID=94328 RepID=UPI001C4D7ACA|nr:recQ-mediated genome instability protein 2-like isoform X1 [Zingiber officinale]
MDYNLAALKLFSGELKDARPSTSSSSPASIIYGILFQRAWLQGVLVSGSDEGRFLLDDGSGVVELLFSAESQPQQWKMGMYVMVVGPYVAAQSNDISTIKVHKIVDLSEQPDREAMWNLEVIEAHKLFYLTSPE